MLVVDNLVTTHDQCSVLFKSTTENQSECEDFVVTCLKLIEQTLTHEM